MNNLVNDNNLKNSIHLGVTRSWLLIALFSLIFSGLLSLLVGASRMPWLVQFVTDTQFARRGLIVHVDLGVLVWFGAMFVVLFRREVVVSRTAGLIWGLQKFSKWAAWISIGSIMSGMVMLKSTPLLVNYIPIIDHWFFIAALGLFYASMLVHFADSRIVFSSLRQGRLPSWGELGGLFIWLTGISAVCGFCFLPRELEPKIYYEALMWGPGHALQFANVCFLMLWIESQLFVKAAVSNSTVSARISGCSKVLILFSAIGFASLCGLSPEKGQFIVWHTWLMQWGIFPAVLLSFGSILFNLFKIKRRASLELNELTFRWSVSLLLVGFLFGSLIRGSDLRIPGHYHASIGAVTIALMAEALSLLGGAKAKSSRVVVWLYGVGQLIFSAGLFIGGTYGMGRKTYGMEQHISNHGQTVGFAVMAIGGVFAFSAGALFAVIAIRAWRRQVVTGEVPAVF